MVLYPGPSGYCKVSLSQEARLKTAFAKHSGLFQFRVMSFGLCNAPATFERLMDRVLQGLRWSRCLVYLDDIISFGSTFDGALSNLTLIFERLWSYGLQLKSTKCHLFPKCHLFRSSVPFLGHIVGRRGLECDPAKIEDVKSWPVPDYLKSVRQFLGFVGYYRRFIPNFADIATPCSTAFSTLRPSLIHAPILAFPTETGQYILEATNFGLGGVLSQIQDDVERVVAYCSCALRPSQRCYCTTKCEMLAAVAMCIQFRSYMRGAKFTLHTDHKSLVWLHRFKDIHRPGNDHGNADGLSRAPSSPCRQCIRPDCPPVVSLPEITDQPFDPHPLGRGLGGSTRRWLISTDSYYWWLFFVFRPSNGRILPALHYMHGFRRVSSPPGLRWRGYILNFAHYGIIITTCHWTTTELFGGSGVHRVLYYNCSSLNPAGSNSSWLTMPPCLAAIWAGTGHWPAWHIGSTGRACRMMSRNGWHSVLLVSRGNLRWDAIIPWEIFPNGHCYILVIADYFSKWTEAFPMKNKCADTVANLLVDNIILCFGMPLVIHSDQGREFENGLMKSLCALLGCTKTRTAPYHLESDVMIERFNRTCLMML